ncbi:hypothetical protein EJP70_26405 [Pseudomonas aeruginosa]|nr:hypothetical protein EJP70_26405 [Pseudomonas aeruginosa]
MLVTKSAIRPGSNFNRQGGSIFHQRQHPELLDSSGSDRLDAARAFAAVYTGGTRARHQLFVPGHLQEWASDTAARARCS